jgi:vancomycin resistance protein VanJ
MGAAWSAVKVEHAPRSHYWYRLVVLSRWAVRKQRLVSIHNGVAMAVTVDRPGRPIRILVVDGHSTITQLRTPMLHDVAQACRRAATAGTPFDLVAGDLNAVARSVGFDALGAVAGGYTLAAHASTGWRATWPVPLPLYDIDHVWVRHGLPILSCDLFANRASDHRGQLVRLALGDHRRAPARPNYPFDPPGSNDAVGAVMQPGR